MSLGRFWTESFWLPANISWADLRNGESEVVYAEPRDFWVQIPLVAIVLTLRFLSERFIFKPLGRRLRISDYKRKAPPNLELETAYRLFSAKRAKLLDFKRLLSGREAERWWRLRARQDRPTALQKFSEVMWRVCHTSISTLYGMYVLWGQDWPWNVDLYFDGYPYQGITTHLRCYYMLTTAIYLSLTITHYRDVKRKDFYIIYLHHTLALLLLYLSWCSQCFRIGSVFLLLSDLSDIFLKFRKVAKYAKLGKLVNYLSVLFVCVWVGTRLVILPGLIMPRTVNQVYALYSTPSPVLLLMGYLLAVVFLLTLMWTLLILKIMIRAVGDGQLKNDVRSSQSEDSDVSISSDVTQNSRNF